jgi:hypothetical protein
MKWTLVNAYANPAFLQAAGRPEALSFVGFGAMVADGAGHR